MDAAACLPHQSPVRMSAADGLVPIEDAHKVLCAERSVASFRFLQMRILFISSFTDATRSSIMVDVEAGKDLYWCRCYLHLPFPAAVT
jgi:hypothetical protein